MTETETFIPPPRVVRPPASTYHLTRWLLLRGLACIYLLAFGSYWGQVDGLIGPEGLAPASDFFERLTRFAELTPGGTSAFWMAPSLCWLAPGSMDLVHGLFALGMCAAAFLLLGIAPLAMSAICWVCYLSVSVAGQVFLAYQWDTLLIEAGLLAIVLAPGGTLPRLSQARPVPVIAIWLYRWLVFRLMFASGALKLASGDPTWSGLTALNYYYFTQPIPNALAWYANQLPAWIQAVSVVLTLVVEGLVPFCVFAPRAFRLAGFVLMSGFMIAIFCTGNYCYFDLLGIVLFCSLLDDHLVRRLCPSRLRGRIPAIDEPGHDAGEEEAGFTPHAIARHVGLVLPVLLLVGFMSMVTMTDLATTCVNGLTRSVGGAGLATNPVRAIPLVEGLHQKLYPLRIVNGYGLFVNMTIRRPEIVIEGSYDGRHFKPYLFKYKVGPLKRRPPQIAPMQPRLDWQMWFEALGAERGNDPSPWFQNLLYRLLENAPPVLDLLEENPFEALPPTYIRAVLYDYRMTDAKTGDSGAWWEREYIRDFIEPVTLGERH